MAFSMRGGVMGVLGAAGSAASWFRRAPRDAAECDQLLALARSLPVPLAPEDIAAIEEALLVGDYPNASRRLAALGLEQAGLARAMPAKLAADHSELRRAWAEVEAPEAGDPLRVQSGLSRLVGGLNDENIPRKLKDKQRWLWKKASALARQRAAARVGAATRPVQQFNDCWLRCLYGVPALEPVRSAMSYDAFFDQVCREFPESDIRRDGLSFVDFDVLIKRMGMTAPPQVLNEDQLARLVVAKGCVIGAIGFFERDTSRMASLEALRYWRQHAVTITSATGKPGRRLFTVDDPGLPQETRYTQAEFEVLQLVVYAVEADPTTTAAALRFFGGARGAESAGP